MYVLGVKERSGNMLLVFFSFFIVVFFETLLLSEYNSPFVPKNLVKSLSIFSSIELYNSL